MIVDGYRGNIKSLSAHLSGLNGVLQIVTATDCETAMARLEAEPLDLVIIDTCLRGKMDGFDVCRALRTATPSHPLPIILILAGVLSLERAKGMAAGADLLLHRPIVKEELLRMVQLLLGHKLDEARNSRPAEPQVAGQVRKLHSVS
jgi:CheY-like chemotaxis protein